MYYAFENHIYFFSSMTTYVFPNWHISFSLCMAINFETIHTCIYTKKKPIHMKCLSWQPHVFYICKPHFFFHIYDPLCIPHFADNFFANDYDIFITFHKYLFSYIYDHLWLLAQWIYFFFLIYSHIFWNCTYICIYNKTNVHEVFSW